MVTARSLSPGEQGKLEITFDGKKRSGQQEKTVRVSSNDPGQETVVLTIRAYIHRALILKPEIARVGPLGPDEERVVRLELLIEDPANVEVSRISSSAPWVGGRIVDDPESEGAMILEVKVAAGRPPGKFQETLTLHTTSPEMPKIDIPVTGMVLDR